MLAVLAIQAYSDLKTMELYYWLTIAAVVPGALPCIIYSEYSDIKYIMACLAIIFFQYLMHAYSIGDAKLCVIVLEMIIMRSQGLEIIIKYLIYNLTAMMIFLLFVAFKRVTDKEKKKKYPYAPAIFIAALLSNFY